MASARGRFALLLFLFLAYASAFIARTSFLVGGTRYFSLFDDAMISMRYARHLASGAGLVWNAGERVEGFTNPLWVFVMAVIHLLPIPLSKTSLAVQVLAAALLLVNLVLVRRIALAIASGSEAVALGAVTLTAFYLPLNNWSLQGMEVSVLVLVVTLAVWLCVSCLDGRDATSALYTMLGISMWVRPDMGVTLAGIACFMAFADTAHRRRHITRGAATLVAGMASQTLFRLWYFDAPLPNTYYLKMTGYPPVWRMARGLYVLAQFVWKANPILFLLALAAAARRDARGWLLVSVLGVQMAYSVYVGGDAWEYWGGANRYIAIAIPAFFILLSDALVAISANRAIFVGAVALSLVCVNSIHGPGALAEMALITPPLHAGPGDENNADVETAIALRGVAMPHASVAVTRAGTLPYFSDLRAIDLLGKTDRRIAMEPARVAADAQHFTQFRPGHSKFDAAYSIGELRPDVIVQPWENDTDAARYLAAYRRVRLGPDCAYVRAASPKIDTSTLESCR